MRVRWLVILILLTFILMMGCSMIQSNVWKNATEDEKARLVLNDMQKTVDTLLDLGAIYVSTHPDKKADWQARVLPMFKSVNGMIGENLKLAKLNQGKVTIAQVLAAIQPKLNELEVIAITWGFSKK